MYLTITSEHISKANVYPSEYPLKGMICPVAQALIDKYDTSFVSAGITSCAYTIYNGNTHISTYSNNLYQQVKNWDSGKGFKPGKYLLRIGA